VIADTVGLGISLVALMASGDQFVIGVSRVAGAIRVRPTVVGAVIGGLGASLPELFVSTVASVQRNPEIAVGNLVGSIVANVCLALAIAALIAPVRVDSRTIRREAPLSVGAVALFALLLLGGLSRLEGAVLTVALVVAIVVLMANASQSPRGDELALEVQEFFERPRPRLGPEVARSLVALTFMIAASDLLVRSASGLAGRLGLAESFVGLTLVAVGTSAPLVAITIQAARRGNHDLLVGNVLGSNLFIALAGGAILGLAQGGPGTAVSLASVALMAGVVVASWAFMARGSLLNRWEAAALIVAYGATLPFLSR